MFRLQKFGLLLNANKCKFFQNGLEFLEHVISPSGVSPMQQRVDDILNAGPLKQIRAQVISWLNYISYKISSISIFSASPTTSATLKGYSLGWSQECMSAFVKAKA